MAVNFEDPSGELNFVLRQGFNNPLTFVLYEDDGSLFDLTGYSAVMTIKETVGAATTILTLTSTPAAGITISIPTATITVTITASQSSAITANCMVYELDLVPASADNTITPLHGTIKLAKEV